MKNKIQKNITIIATITLFIILFLGGSIKYTNFFTAQVFFNLFIDNAYLIVVATGLTFTILTGGIDLSVGAVVALVSMICAALLKNSYNPFLVITIALAVGASIGTFQGFIITKFKLHPWIVTLAGMFFARGLCYFISIESIVINNKVFASLSQYKIEILNNASINISVIISILVVITAIYISKFTKFGRNVYAIGGSEQSALLMGLPVVKTKILVYTLSGFCAALGGVLFTVYTLSGYGLHCLGMEMDAIAACVIGGILLTGGFGSLIGPMFGVLSTGVIQTLIMFEGTLSSWWTKIVIGFLLFIFMALQRFIVTSGEKNKIVLKNNSKMD